MCRIPGESFLMGYEDFDPEERPVRRVEVESFWIDPHPVTVAKFRRFVKATGHVSVAERPLDPSEYPDGALVPASLVFRPVGAFPANGYALYDMTGNVWDWTCDEGRTPAAAAPCCPPPELGAHIARRVIKGGSHLCAPNYCLRYRPAARQFEAIDISTTHIGYRCVVRGA
jgi:formylglycine-generating enzyme required for sulfatase activity